MERKQGPFYRIRWFLNIVKHGLFWHGVRNRLARIGLDFMPYYWEVGSIDIEQPQLRDEASNYVLSKFGKEEIAYIQSKIVGIAHKNLLRDLSEGDTCLGLKKDGEICVYTFIKHGPFSFRGRKFDIKPFEGYVHNTYTFEAYRGKNLAPYIRYQCYKYFENIKNSKIDLFEISLFNSLLEQNIKDFDALYDTLKLYEVNMEL